jgi:flagellar motor switch protein FliN/FliY
MADPDEPVPQDEIERLLAEASSQLGADDGNDNSPSDASSELSQSPQASQSDAGTQPAGQLDAEGPSGSVHTAAPPSHRASSSRGKAGPPIGTGGLPQGDVEFLLDQAQEALKSIDAGTTGDTASGASAYRLTEFSGAPANTENATLDLIRDVELDLKIELGRTHLYLEDVLRLGKGSVVPLDKLAGDPVDIYVNGRLIARGEVLVLNDNFCVRVAELVAGSGAE